MWFAIISAVCLVAGMVDFLAIRRYRHFTTLVNKVKLIPFIGLVIASFLILASVIFSVDFLRMIGICVFIYCFLPAVAYRKYYRA